MVVGLGNERKGPLKRWKNSMLSPFVGHYVAKWPAPLLPILSQVHFSMGKNVPYVPDSESYVEIRVTVCN